VFVFCVVVLNLDEDLDEDNVPAVAASHG